MTVKELSNVFDVSVDTVQNVIKEFYPAKMQKGKKTYLTKEESILVGENIRKKGYIQPTIKSEVLPIKSELDRFDRLEKIVMSLAEIVKTQIDQTSKLLLSNNQKQIEVKQDYYSILAYMLLKNIDEAVFSQMICYGKEASRVSRELNKPIRKIPDERYGHVNSYHLSVLEKVFEL